MKKQLVILIAVFISLKTTAQTGQKFHFGLKAAPSLAWFKTDTKGLSSDGSKIGFGYGLITEFNFAEHYAFSTGVDVVYQGGKFKSSITALDTTRNYSATYSLEYIEIPLTLKLKTKEIGMITYYLQAGLAPAFNIRAREDLKTTVQPKTGSTTSSDSTDIDIMKNINLLNISMILGGGLEYSLSGNTALMAGLTFSNGLLDVLDGSGSKANSNYLALTVGILF